MIMELKIAASAVAILLIAGFAVDFGALRSGLKENKPADKIGNAAPSAGYHKITAKEAYKMMEAEEKFVLLDVRTDEEYSGGHIKKAVLIPDYEIASRAEAELPDKNERIFVYCRSGRRSVKAAKELVKMGYTNVYDFGGIMDWPYETVTD